MTVKKKAPKQSKSKTQPSPGTAPRHPKKKVGRQKSPDKPSAIDAAAKVLAEAGAPMTTRAMIETMAAKDYWKSPGGKTPHATLYSAILREIATKGAEARFVKAEPGKFVAKA